MHPLLPLTGLLDSDGASQLHWRKRLRNVLVTVSYMAYTVKQLQGHSRSLIGLLAGRMMRELRDVFRVRYARAVMSSSEKRSGMRHF
jgi:hypothetical protein